MIVGATIDMNAPVPTPAPIVEFSIGRLENTIPQMIITHDMTNIPPRAKAAFFELGHSESSSNFIIWHGVYISHISLPNGKSKRLLGVDFQFPHGRVPLD